jgi:hypothetical protein
MNRSPIREPQNKPDTTPELDRLVKLIELDLPHRAPVAITASPSSIRYCFYMPRTVWRTSSAFASAGNPITSRSDIVCSVKTAR